MAKKKARLGYWSLDLKQFVFWISVALVVDAIPDLSINIHWLLLFGIWIIAIAAAFLIWIRDKRKDGIGVYVHLPRLDDKTPPDDALLRSIHHTMNANHRDWFRAGPHSAASEIRERVDWAVTTIQHRLNEAFVQAGHKPEIFLYLHCRLAESFFLGQKVGRIWGAEHPLSPFPEGKADSTELKLSLRVRSISIFKNKEGDIFELDFQKITNNPAPPIEAVRHEIESLQSHGKGPAPRAPRLAIILHASERESDFQSFKKAAIDAAGGSSYGGYLMDENDECDNAVILSITPDALFASLQQKDGEKFIQQIRSICVNASVLLYGRTNVPARVFMDAPSIFAFAAGAILPAESKFVTYDARVAQAATHGVAAGEHEVIAIIDGDDIGNGMEQSLLNGNLSEATRYSEQVDLSLKRLVNGACAVPGVELISSGGDSAIFGFPRASFAAFEDALNALRSELKFKVSCGYGTGCQQAFFSLRLAKTSGKNITVGSL